jgi:hypothetical protein
MRFLKRIIAAAMCCLGMVGLLSSTRNVNAGWTGYLLGSGTGWAYTSISPWSLYTNSAGLVYYTNLTASALKSVTITNPGSYQGKLTPATDPSNTNRLVYTTNKISPIVASSNTIARAWGTTGAVWTAYSYGGAGDKTDNFELQNRVKIKPANCAELALDTALTSFNGTGGEITVRTFGTTGTALWLRGFEITPGMVVPEDDLITPENETTEFLKEFAELRFENLIIGPFEYGYNFKCELVIHFTLESGDINNLAFVTDGVALSDPIKINCPESATVVCGDPYSYPVPSATGGCGTLTYSYSPALEALVAGVNNVTLTVTDGEGDSETCEFTVTIIPDTVPPVAPALPDVLSSCGAPVTLTAPTATDNCIGPVIGTTTNLFPITGLGTHLVVWTFNDGNGNSSTSTQKVVISGMTFVGFYAPIGTSGGFCDRAAKNIKSGSVIPIKFDVKCGSTLVTTGPAPTVRVEKWNSSTCTVEIEFPSMNAEYQNYWHANWDTSGLFPGLYKIIVRLSDGSEPYVFVNLK